ncbi:MAG: hypothetical protein V4669_08825 [Pseudomonadota bacterium]
MAVIPPFISGLRPGQAPNSRPSVGPNLQIQRAGTPHRTNIFARTWELLTRSPEQVAANKQVARAFVHSIREAHGDAVADLASRQLKGQLAHGRPLTERRFERVLESSRKMTGHIAAGNQQIMDRQFDDMLRDSVGRTFKDGSENHGLSEKECREVVRNAIRSDPDFAAVPFQTAAHGLVGELLLDDQMLDELDQAFVSHYSKVADAALRNAAAVLESSAPEDIEWLFAQGKDVVSTLMRFTPQELHVLNDANLSIEIGLQYKDRGVPIHPRTMVRELCGDNIVGTPTPLGGGSVSRPYRVNYGGRQMVFKEATVGEGYGPQSERLGIDKADPRMAVRNVATRVVDEVLRFNLVPDTQFATSKDGKLGIAMEFAHGTSPAPNLRVNIEHTEAGKQILVALEEFSADDRADLLAAAGCSLVEGRLVQEQQFAVQELNYADPALRNALVKLQLLDALTAQGDRHPGNYVVQLSADGSFNALRPIDNDQAFSPTQLNPNELVHLSRGEAPATLDGKLFGNTVFNGVGLPPVVDRDMKTQIDRITPEELREKLGGLLTEKEVQAAIVRLGTIKAHLTRLEKAGNVISPSDWGSARVTALLQDPKTSYIGRDAAYVKTLRPVAYQEAKS